MKRLLRQLSLLLALPLLFVGAVDASNHFWKIEISDPTTANQLRTFNVEYTALSVDTSDQITVNLLQDGTQVDTDTTPGGGGSGAFEVTVEEDGSYVYQLQANSSLDSVTKSSEARAVTVETPEGQDQSTITVEPELTPEQEAGLIAVGANGQPVEGGGDVAGATDDEGAQQDDGEITDEAASTTTGEDGDVLGVEDSVEEAATSNTVRILLALGVALLIAYYWVFYRNGRVNPFSRTEE
jgi:hypothetical protein